MNFTILQASLILVLLGGGIFYVYFITTENEEQFTRPPLFIDKPESKLSPMDCPPVMAKDPQWQEKIIVIDPGHRYRGQEEGFGQGSLTEAAIVERIAYFLTLKSSNIKSTRASGEIKSLSERVGVLFNEDASIIISLHVGNETNVVKAYAPYGSKESNALACQIVNAILNDKDLFTEKMQPLEGKNIISINPQLYSDDDPEYMLRANKPAVLLEIGSVQIPEAQNFLTNQIGIAQAIYSGMQGYYE